MECPGCNIDFNDDWDAFLFSRNEVNISTCPACHLRHVEVSVFGPEDKHSNYLTKTISFKKTQTGNTPVVEVTFDCQDLYMLPKIAFDYYKTPIVKEIPASVPEDLANDCREAHKIFRYSPRSSALLARRILEKTLKDNGHKQSTLYAQLESLAKSNELSSIDMDKLRAVRNLGNISAHYKEKSQTLLDVETGEAELCLQIVDELITHYYVNPAEASRINSKINK